MISLHEAEMLILPNWRLVISALLPGGRISPCYGVYLCLMRESAPLRTLMAASPEPMPNPAPSTVYFGGDDGVFRSRDGEDNWHTVSGSVTTSYMRGQSMAAPS